MEKCYLLEAADFVQKNLSWFFMNEYICLEAGNKLGAQINELIKELAKYQFEICRGFGIPEHVIYAPIYTGLKEYYSVDKTDGEHYNLPRTKF